MTPRAYICTLIASRLLLLNGGHGLEERQMFKVDETFSSAELDVARVDDVSSRSPVRCSAICARRTGCSSFIFEENRCQLYNEDIVSTLARPDGDVNKQVYRKKQCPDMWLTFGDYCYTYYTLSEDYAGSQAVCFGVGATVVKITDSDTGKFIASLSSDVFFIQANDPEVDGVWEFDDGSVMTYFDWESGQPNNYGPDDQNCIKHVSVGWDDIWCDSAQDVVVCQREP